MNYNDIIKNPVMWTDYYNISHHYLKTNQDWEASHIYNRQRGQILYGFNEQAIDWFDNMKITEDNVNEANKHAIRMHKEQQFPMDMFMRIVKEFNGLPPIAIEAIPDGTYCPTGTPFAQIRNTVKGFGELVTWWEPVLLKPFFPSGCATRAMWMARYLKDNSLPLNRLHSFGFRGYQTKESAYWGSTAWNLFLEGSDDFASAAWTPNAPITSIAAEAHKVIEQFDNEMEAYKFGIDSAKAHGQTVLAICIDTYDPWRFINKYLVEVANYGKTKGLWIVFRPDSGNVLEQAHAIWNKKQQSNLDNISVIIGEGMSFYKVREYDATLKTAGIPLNFVYYGVGAGFYNDISRDYLGWSMKTAYSNCDNRMKLVVSAPSKQSIPGVVDLLYDSNGEMYVDLRGNNNYVNDFRIRQNKSLFNTVWTFDEFNNLQKEVNPQSWDEIYKIAHEQLPKQLSIKLSSSIQREIKRIRLKYGINEIAQNVVESEMIQIPEEA